MTKCHVELASNQQGTYLFCIKHCKKFDATTSISGRGEWTNESLEETTNVVERGTCSLRKGSMSWNIRISSVFNHLNEKKGYRNIGLTIVLIEEEDVTLV